MHVTLIHVILRHLFEMTRSWRALLYNQMGTIVLRELACAAKRVRTRSKG